MTFTANGPDHDLEASLCQQGIVILQIDITDIRIHGGTDSVNA